MEHILQFAVDIDDQKIINAVESNGVKQIIDGIKIDILNRIFSKGYYNSSAITTDSKGNIKLSPEAGLSSFAKNIVQDAIDELKPEIINAAADKLVESYKRTKAWKDRAQKELDICNRDHAADVDKLLAERLAEQKRYSHEDLGILGQ